MPTDLFFLNTMPQNPSISMQHSKIGSWVKSQFPNTYATDRSWGDNHKSFAATLRKASHDQHAKNCSMNGHRSKPITREAFEQHGKPGKTRNYSDRQDEGASQVISSSENRESREIDQKPLRRDFSACLDLLEKLGLLDPAGGTSSQTESMEGESKDGSVTLKTLNERLAQLDSLLSPDMITELESLRQSIAKALAGIISSQPIADQVDGLALSEESKLAELVQLLTGMNSGEENKGDSHDGHTALSVSGEKTADVIAAINRLAAEAGNTIGEAGANKSAEDSEITSSSENREKVDTGKLTATSRADGAEAGESAKEAAALRIAAADSSRLEGDADMVGKARVSGKTDHQDPNSAALSHGIRNGGEPLQQNRPIDESAQVTKIVNDAAGAKDSDRGERLASESGQEKPSDNESSAVSKMVKDAQAVKDNPLKMGAVTSDDLGGKINTPEGGTNYNGLFNSEGQNAEKAFESISSTKESETGQSALKTMTLDQIVQKAVIHLKNGQHEARIHLKPDYLGHVRMQVITENQQVTVKILTEFSFVKDLIENNAHQLKADLQQQGLNVDKLEVSVSTDRDEHKHEPEKGDRLNPRSYQAGPDSTDNLKEDVRLQTAHMRRNTAGASAVDYFA